jgi:hypothetical protein
MDEDQALPVVVAVVDHSWRPTLKCGGNFHSKKQKVCYYIMQ